MVIVLISLVWNLVVPNAGFDLETEVTQSPAGWLPQGNAFQIVGASLLAMLFSA
ncbi:hypothetical protein D3C75_1301650 [compost metagenome]